MKNALRFLALSLVFTLLSSLFVVGISVNAAPTGTSFKAEDLYRTDKGFSDDVKTFEATFTLPVDYATNGERAGGILSNFVDTVTACSSIEIYTNGNPRIYTVYQDKNGSRQSSHVFDQVNVATGKKVHLAVTIDPNKKELRCYVDGVLKQTLNPTFVSPTCITTNPVYLGGGSRSGNPQYFRGTLYSAVAYKDIRTATEVASDKNSSVNTNDSDLIAAYELSGLPSSFKDLSKNGYDAIRHSKWFTDKEPVTNFDYSFVAVGDTQTVSHYAPEKMATIYDWIVNNISKKKIKFVMGLGDIIDWYQNDPNPEWKNAAAAIKKMDGKVPYSLCRGNHDGANEFNKYFPYSEYKNTVGGTYDNTSILNSWRKFEINGIKYMLFTLDYSPSDDVLAWASNIIAQNPTYNVIITTHAYLYSNGTTLDGTEPAAPSISSGATHGPNDGDDIWNKLISKHQNIVMVFSGHIDTDRVVLTQTKGKNGTVVSQFLIDPQGVDLTEPTGLVAVFYFSNGGSRVTVEYYSTIKNQYFLKENQYSFDVAVIDSTGNTKPSSSTTKPSTSTTTSTTKSTTSTTKSSATTQSTASTSASTSTSQTVNQGGQTTASSTSQTANQGGSASQSNPAQSNPAPNNTTSQMDTPSQDNQTSQNSTNTTTTPVDTDNVNDEGTDNSLVWVLVGIGAFVAIVGIVVLVLVARKRK